MEWLEYYKPVMVLVLLQFAYATMTVLSKASFSQGMSPRVLVVYREAIGTLFTAPLAYFSRRTTERCMGWKNLLLIFITTLFGITGFEMLVNEGISLASPAVANALLNLIPAVTFVVASIVGYTCFINCPCVVAHANLLRVLVRTWLLLMAFYYIMLKRFEPINIRSLRTIVKILGTLFSVGGAATMALIKGPKILNENLSSIVSLSLNSPGNDNLWLLGCLYVFGACCCWSSWLIIQVPITSKYPDHLSLSAWMCFFSMIQSATITYFTDPSLEDWGISSYLQLGTCLFAGIVGSGLNIFGQSWVVERKGPVFSAMFQPLSLVFVTFFASIFLQEQIYIGSVIGAVGIMTGLYMVLWGKAKDAKILKEEREKIMRISQDEQPNIVMDGGSNLENPLLTKEADNF